MKALVLVGGFGTRLRPITYEIPKQLIPLAGRPMLYHVIEQLPADTEEVIFASGYKSDVVAAFLRDHPPRLPARCVAETEPLGTGGGLLNAAAGLTDPFFFLNSDVIADVDLGALAAFQGRHGGVGSMTLTEVADPSPYGVVAMAPGDRIERFVEKPKIEEAPSRWINAGLSIWRREVLELIPRGRPVSWEQEIVPQLLGRGVYGFQARGYWEDAGTPDRLLHAQRLLFDGGRGGPGTLPKGSHGQGPVALGAGVEARGATFGPYVHLDPGVHVGVGAHVANSIVMEGSEIGDGASVTDSVLGPRVRISPGTTVHHQVLGVGAQL
jgi:mannose-1-phosphate guanylyltransferase